jgi:hypothetical protein
VLLGLFIFLVLQHVLEALAHRGEHTQNPFYRQLYVRVVTEVAILGVFSFVLFAIALDENIDAHIEVENSDLLYLIEFVHVAVFFTGCFYIAIVLCLVLTVDWIIAGWTEGAAALESKLQAVAEQALKAGEEWNEERALTQLLQDELAEMAKQGQLTDRCAFWKKVAVRVLSLGFCGGSHGRQRTWRVRQMQALYALRQVYKNEAFAGEGAPEGARGLPDGYGTSAHGHVAHLQA